MPCSDQPRRMPRRLAALCAVIAVLSTAALSAPSSASAYQQQFCYGAWMLSGTNCFAQYRHTLQNVYGWNQSDDRICAASWTSQWGYQNSDWRCEYGFVQKSLGGRVDGVGAIRNGDPQHFVGYGVQEF